MWALEINSQCCNFKLHRLSVLLLAFFFGTMYPILGYSIHSHHVNSTSGQRKVISGNMTFDLKENTISHRSEGKFCFL